MSDSMIVVLLCLLFAFVSVYMAWGLILALVWFTVLVAGSIAYGKTV